jgi:hypothetical protein
MLYVPEASPSSVDNEEPSIPILPLVSATKSKDEVTFIRRSSSGSSPPPTSQQDVGAMVWSLTRQTSAKPGHVERLRSQTSTESESSSSRTVEDRLKTNKQVQKTLSIDENHQIDEECLQRFIKVNVRLMTDDHVRKRDLLFPKEGSAEHDIYQLDVEIGQAYLHSREHEILSSHFCFLTEYFISEKRCRYITCYT